MLRSDNPSAMMKEFLTTLKEFSVLLQDPKKMQSSITNAMALADHEQKQANEAKNLIAQASNIRAEIKKKDIEHEENLKRANDLLRQAEEKQRQNERDRVNLDKIRDQQTQKDKQHLDTDAKHQRERDELDQTKVALDKLNAALDEKQKKTMALDSELKKRMEILKASAEGL